MKMILLTLALLLACGPASAVIGSPVVIKPDPNTNPGPFPPPPAGWRLATWLGLPSAPTTPLR